MSFMVNFRSSEGKQGYHPTDTLEEAVRFVEHVRNQEHVTDARVWRLQEIPLEVKTYYKVEVVAPGVEAAAPAVRPDEEPRADAVPVAAGVEAGGMTGANVLGAQGGPGGPAGPNGARFGRFNRT